MRARRIGDVTAVDVRIYEVGPRDGLQSEPTVVATNAKRHFIGLLADAGLREIEVTSFVSPKAIPQLADADELISSLDRRPGVRYPVLVPNRRGLERAITANVDAICLFTAASDAYAQHNIGMSIDASLDAFAPLAAEARSRGWWIRGYVSTAFGCPYDGEVDERAVISVGERLLAMGADELAISDTVGVAAPTDVRRVLGALYGAGIGHDVIALHFHDTRGTAAANVLAAMEMEVRTFDASTGGTGGSPFAPGAAGNMATEDLVYLLDREGVRHGVDLDRVLDAARFIHEALGTPLTSKVGLAGGWPQASRQADRSSIGDGQ
jgi:hydroxymethylglutaryl-CoA lyase